MLTTKSIVGYARVSSQKQGESGLGLESQMASLEAFAREHHARLLQVYVEVESGRRDDRPELTKALAHARRARATLVVSKLDRLARSCLFLARLLDSDVPFLAIDNFSANRLTIHILSAVAEAEARAISQRTKDALAAYKARGGRLGAALPQCRNLTEEAAAKGRAASAIARGAAARAAREELAPLVLDLRAQGLTLDEVARKLNDQGLQTRRGKAWTKGHVSLLLDALQQEGGRS
jgi:DNA invertase Pin-like site-specific DNA recombinase